MGKYHQHVLHPTLSNAELISNTQQALAKLKGCQAIDADTALALLAKQHDIPKEALRANVTTLHPVAMGILALRSQNPHGAAGERH